MNIESMCVDGAPLIRETPRVSGGYPCIGDTRIPVRSLVLAYRQTHDFDLVVAAFPQLQPDVIRAALDWYILHPAAVDDDIRRNAESMERILSR
jgi:uncharacterized protein (DUF433 family)